MSTRYKSLVFSFVADDQPGIVEVLAAAVKAAGGNWLQSQLTHLGGLFAGLVVVSVSSNKEAELITALQTLAANNITVNRIHSTSADSPDNSTGSLVLVGPDRSGIVHEITRAMAAHHINIEAMETSVSSAPMSGEPLFEASITFSVAAETLPEQLLDAIDAIADQLTLDIQLNAD